MEMGLAGLVKDAPRPGRTPTITPAKVQEVIRRTTQEKPAHSTHWSTRTMAEAVGVSEKSVRRIWHKHGLKPHLSTLSALPERLPASSREGTSSAHHQAAYRLFQRYKLALNPNTLR